MIDHPSSAVTSSSPQANRLKSLSPHPQTAATGNPIVLKSTQTRVVARTLLDFLNNKKDRPWANHALARLHDDAFQGLLSTYVRRMVFVTSSGNLEQYEPICPKAQLGAEVCLLINRPMGWQPARGVKRPHRTKKRGIQKGARRSAS